MLIFIIGYMGSGKSTFGRKLAAQLDYRFEDLDEKFCPITGFSIASFFDKFGENAFREKEREILVNFIENGGNVVIATGGGTPCYLDNMDLMNNAGITVFLDVPVDILSKRLAESKGDRPLLGNVPPDGLKDFISQHLQSRMMFYLKAKVRI